MYIIQIADLHIGSSSEASLSEEQIVKESIMEIKNRVPFGEKLLFCACGDVIDGSKLEDTKENEVSERYKAAARLLKLYKKNLENDYILSMKFCIGNHDVTHSAEFYICVKELDEDITTEDLEETYFCEVEGTCYIFVNSCYGNQYDKGMINYDGLLRTLESIPHSAKKILVLHHTLMSMDKDDKSSIRDAASLLGIIDKYNFVGVLHGHIHGRDILQIGKRHCKVIGTGALFSRNHADVNSQFNIIHIQNGMILDVFNCRFIADGVKEGRSWNVLNIGGINCENYFSGNNFKAVYEELLDKLGVVTPLYNMVLHISCDYESFVKNLKEYLESDILKIGKKEFTYFELARMWEAVDVPRELYFNHGQYFKVDGKPGIDLIARQLKDKPTSNRTVLSTFNMDTIVGSLEEQEYLPSLSSIQFSMDKTGEELFIHMHLRALEANRFLKINICEIAYLLEELKKKKIRFDNVNIMISAFRVQKSEKFNCFIKSEIDEMLPVKLAVKVNSGKIDDICRLLEEKKDATETITKMEGIKNLSDAMRASNDEKSDDDNKIYYESIILNLLDNLLVTYKKLDSLQKSSSIRSDEEKEYENMIEKLLCDLIYELTQISKEKEERI